MSNVPIVIFSDLDGCLLDKFTYSFEPARPVLERIRQQTIPLVLASSKTVAEMVPLAKAMELSDAPLICENGGAVFDSNQHVDSSHSVLGCPRERLLEVLDELKSPFQFASFRDLGLSGVMEATGLPAEKAELALQRSSTEPLLWRDAEDKIDDFRSQIERAGLSLTKGGRFWHVAGLTSKGRAMQHVLGSWGISPSPVSLAIGDSPIDQSMLDVADYPIGIPTPSQDSRTGVVHVVVSCDNGRIASQPGPQGWAEAVTEVLDELDAG